MTEAQILEVAHGLMNNVKNRHGRRGGINQRDPGDSRDVQTYCARESTDPVPTQKKKKKNATIRCTMHHYTGEVGVDVKCRRGDPVGSRVGRRAPGSRSLPNQVWSGRELLREGRLDPSPQSGTEWPP